MAELTQPLAYSLQSRNHCCDIKHDQKRDTSLYLVVKTKEELWNVKSENFKNRDLSRYAEEEIIANLKLMKIEVHGK